MNDNIPSVFHALMKNGWIETCFLLSATVQAHKHKAGLGTSRFVVFSITVLHSFPVTLSLSLSQSVERAFVGTVPWAVLIVAIVVPNPFRLALDPAFAEPPSTECSVLIGLRMMPIDSAVVGRQRRLSHSISIGLSDSGDAAQVQLD